MNDKKMSLLPKLLLPWFSKNARALPWREDKAPYHVWVSEIMLQQTRVEAVKEYYKRFIKTLPTIEALANAEEEELLKLWEGLGYYSRVRNLQKAAQVIVEKHDGVFPTEYEEILALPGIGEYTAGAISSICFGKPTPAVDGNVLRVISRVTESKTPVTEPKVKKEITEKLRAVYPEENCGDFTQGLMELGATVCVPNGTPHCVECPLKNICLAHKNGTAEKLPVKSPKKTRKKEKHTVFLLNCDGKIAVSKRAKEGLLKGLWEFPNVKESLSKEQAAEQLEKWDIVPKDILQKVKRKHIFTHIEWDMTGFSFACKNQNEQFLWKTKEELLEEIALPTAFRKFLTLIP